MRLWTRCLFDQSNSTLLIFDIFFLMRIIAYDYDKHSKIKKNIQYFNNRHKNKYRCHPITKKRLDVPISKNKIYYMPK